MLILSLFLRITLKEGSDGGIGLMLVNDEVLQIGLDAFQNSDPGF